MGNARQYNVAVKRKLTEEEIPQLAQEIFKEEEPFTGYSNRESDEKIIQKLEIMLHRLNKNELDKKYKYDASGNVTTGSFDAIFQHLEDKYILEVFYGSDDYSFHYIPIDENCEELNFWDEEFQQKLNFIC